MVLMLIGPDKQKHINFSSISKLVFLSGERLFGRYFRQNRNHQSSKVKPEECG
uniref:Uncharacterized protein n=1 Tax=Anguilla anguilla TaxID=7936 RepID=A0A0E9S8B8_ANGAN